MRKIREFIKSNKGVSLVELVIGMAILTIIGFAIAVFMKNGTMSYASTSKEVNLQYDAQIVTNQINDVLTEANGDITFIVDGSGAVVNEGGSPASVEKQLQIVTSDRQIDATTKDAIVTYQASIVQWIPGSTPEEGKLWYHTGTATYDSTKNKYICDAVDSHSELLAEKVTMFTADLGSADDDVVNVMVSFTDGNKSFDSTTNISLRNAPTKNAASVDWTSA
ncbi:MAG: prepilin-type N-terminal cleavage/methylation domain-containing protein, partial [Lachnospiraceae bacterium]|nr:prepilin-type N-terminal cleavage/methylation domain-containing protein [Lachnospiraceae bacterium]